MADIKINGATPSAFYFGSTAASAVYYGSTKLWEASAPTPTTKSYRIECSVNQAPTPTATLQLYSLAGYYNNSDRAITVSECKGRADYNSDWSSITGDPCASTKELGLSQAITTYISGFQVFCTVPADTNKFTFEVYCPNVTRAADVSGTVYEYNDGVIGNKVASFGTTTLTRNGSKLLTLDFSGT